MSENLVEANRTILKLEKTIENQTRGLAKLTRDLEDTRKVFGDTKKEKNEFNKLLDEQLKEQDQLRSQLEAANISRYLYSVIKRPSLWLITIWSIIR